MNKNEDKNGNGELSAEEVYAYAEPIVDRISDLKPDDKINQHPVLYDAYPSGTPTTGELAICIGEPSGTLLAGPPVPARQTGKKLLELVNAPKVDKLHPNYPNPFNPETWIPYELAKDANITISIYNAKGQLIRTLNLGEQKAGVYVSKDKAAYWDGWDSAGERVGSGVYFYTLQAGDFKATRRMVIVK